MHGTPLFKSSKKSASFKLLISLSRVFNALGTSWLSSKLRLPILFSFEYHDSVIFNILKYSLDVKFLGITSNGYS